MSDLALTTVPFHRATEPLAHDDSGIRPIRVRDEVHHQAAASDTSALPDSGTHPRPRMQAVVAGKHVTP